MLVKGIQYFHSDFVGRVHMKADSGDKKCFTVSTYNTTPPPLIFPHSASHWFPYVKKRIPVIHQEQFDLTAIQVISLACKNAGWVEFSGRKTGKYSCTEYLCLTICL